VYIELYNAVPRLVFANQKNSVNLCNRFCKTCTVVLCHPIIPTTSTDDINKGSIQVQMTFELLEIRPTLGL